MHRKGHQEFENRRVCLDHVASRLRGDKQLTASDRATFRSVLCGAVMTHDEAASLGYVVNNVCPLCGAASDTVFHRVWLCTHPEVVAARNKHAPRWLQEEARRRGPCDALYTLALFPNPSDIWPRPRTEASLHLYAARDGCTPDEGWVDGADYADALKRLEKWTPSDDELTADFIAGAVDDAPIEASFNRSARIQLGGRLYADGSCTQSVFRELRRAAAGLVVKQP